MLGSVNGLPWANNITGDASFSPNNINNGGTPIISSCIAWYDFTDQSSIYKDNSGLITIGDNEHIGRIKNKASAGTKLGSFLRSVTSGTSPGDVGGANAPKFKLNGENGLSYAEFDSTGSAGGGSQCLVGSDYYNFSSLGHGGGVGGITYSYNNDGFYPSFLENNLAPDPAAPNNNFFSFSLALDNTAMTVFWIVKPSTADPSGSARMTHWLIRPDDSDDSGVGRAGETYFEGGTNPSNDDFLIAHNDEENNTSYSSEGGDVTAGLNILMGVFGSGTNATYLSQNFSTAIDSKTITQNTFSIVSGMMALGHWSLGNINSGAVADSGYDGDFYEIIIYNKELSGAEIAEVFQYLNGKYN